MGGCCWGLRQSTRQSEPVHTRATASDQFAVAPWIDGPCTTSVPSYPAITRSGATCWTRQASSDREIVPEVGPVGGRPYLARACRASWAAAATSAVVGSRNTSRTTEALMLGFTVTKALTAWYPMATAPRVVYGVGEADPDHPFVALRGRQSPRPERQRQSGGAARRRRRCCGWSRRSRSVGALAGSRARAARGVRRARSSHARQRDDDARDHQQGEHPEHPERPHQALRHRLGNPVEGVHQWDRHPDQERTAERPEHPGLRPHRQVRP